MNIWMVAENLMKHHYLKNSQKNFHSHLNMKDITDADYGILGIIYEKKFVKTICKKFIQNGFIIIFKNVTFKS